MLRRILSLVLVLGLCLSCAALPALAAYDPDQSYTLSFYYWDEGQKPGMDAVVELFEAAYPNIKIESTIIPWNQYWTKLQTSLPSGTGPDIFWMNLYAAEYIKAGLLLDITDRVAADGVDLTKFPKGVLDLYTNADGHYFGIPKDFDSIAICYNKAIFDELGVPYPTNDWTWDDFVETCRATTKDGYYGFYVNSATNACVSDFIYSNNGAWTNESHDVSTANDPKNVEALQFLHDLMYVEKVSPDGAEQSEMSQDDMFVNGMVAMVPAGSWSISTYYEGLGDDLAIVEFPTKERKGNVTHGLAYCISSLSPNADAAWEFLKFAATYEAQVATASVVVPAYEGAYQSWVDSYPSLELDCYIRALEYAGTNAIYVNGQSEASTITTEALSTIWLTEDVDIQAVMDDCQAKIQAVIDAQ